MKRLLIVGCGDVGMRMLPLLRGRYRLFALTRPAREREATLRALGVTPLAGDLDDAQSLCRLSGLPHDVLHFAPPPGAGAHDGRTGNLIRALQKARSIPQRLVYISTSGVYGDCGGRLVHEHQPLRPQTERAVRRADAERQLREWGRRSGVGVVILRVPGIYAADRLPLQRLRAGTPALVASEDPYTNHIHADDLARVVVAALARGRGQRIYNASDDSALRMGEYFDLVADTRRAAPTCAHLAPGCRPSRSPRCCCHSCASPGAWRIHDCDGSCACACAIRPSPKAWPAPGLSGPAGSANQAGALGCPAIWRRGVYVY